MLFSRLISPLVIDFGLGRERSTCVPDLGIVTGNC